MIFSPKLDNFEKQLAIALSENWNFRRAVSKELLKVTVICVYTPFLSFLMLIYHHAVLVFSHVSTKS